MIQIVLLVLLVCAVVFVINQARVVAQKRSAQRSEGIPRPVSGRLIAVLLLGIALGVGVHSDYAAERLKGKDGFLRAQAQRYDSFISKEHSLVMSLFLGVATVTAAVGIYELIAWGVGALTRQKKHGAA